MIWVALKPALRISLKKDLANIFANWFSKYAIKNDFPAWTSFTEKNKPSYWQQGSFHGGSPLFFFDLYAVTKQKKWLTVGLKICNKWKHLFQKADPPVHSERGSERTATA